MSGKTIKVTSSKGGAFDCYLSLPAGSDKAPAIVLACAIHGVDKDLRDIADEFASKGFIAAAPDLFWSSIPGPMGQDDKRAAERAQPRPEKIAAGEADMTDTLAHLKTLPQFNGRAAAIGFCYGGPYAILGPKRLGYAAGLSCHGTRMQDYIGRTRRRHAAGLHYVGRSGPRRAERSAGCLPRRAAAPEERRGPHISRHPARLHDARACQGLRCQEPRVLDDTRAGDSRRIEGRWLAPSVLAAVFNQPLTAHGARHWATL